MPVTVTEFPATITTLTNESPCLTCLPNNLKDIAIVWAMAQLLKYSDGGDYTNVNTLNSAAKCYKCESDSALKAFALQIWLDAAQTAGMPAMTIEEFTASIKCWQCLDPKAAKAGYIFLLNLILQG